MNKKLLVLHMQMGSNFVFSTYLIANLWKICTKILSMGIYNDGNAVPLLYIFDSVQMIV